MASQVPSKSQSDSGLPNQVSKYLIGIFLIWTVLLFTYTLTHQHDCSYIIWWQQVDRVSCWQTSVTPESVEIRPGETATLRAKVTGTGYYNPEIHWKSQSPSIAFLDPEEGKQVLVKGKESGKAKISVRIGLENQNSAKNPAQFFEVPIEVLPTLSITPQELRIKEGLEQQLSVEFTGVGWFTNKSISWKVANPDIIKIDDNNRVKALKTGSTTLTAVWTEDPRVSQTIEASVIENPPQITGINLPSYTQTLYVGETVHLNAQAICKGNCTAADTRIFWSSDHPEQAAISPDGDLNAFDTGQVTLTATSIIDQNQFRSFTIEILDPIVTDVQVQPSPVKVGVNKTKRVKAMLNGRGDFNRSVSWTSANPKIAQVDENGIVAGVKKGKTKLEARSVSHPNQVAVAKVNVESGGCSAGTAVAIGAVVTIGSSALLVPPPIALAAGSAAATGLCWIVDKVN